LLCSAASSRLGLGDNNKRELESERKKEEEEEEEEGDHPSTHVAVEKAQARGRPGRRLCACARVVWYGIRKRDPATPQSSRELRDTKLQKRRGTERTRPPAWPCVKVCFLRTHAWTFSCAAAAAAASVLLPRARSSAVDASNVQRLGGRRGSLGASYDARGQTRGYETAA